VVRGRIRGARTCSFPRQASVLRQAARVVLRVPGDGWQHAGRRGSYGRDPALFGNVRPPRGAAGRGRRRARRRPGADPDQPALVHDARPRAYHGGGLARGDRLVRLLQAVGEARRLTPWPARLRSAHGYTWALSQAGTRTPAPRGLHGRTLVPGAQSAPAYSAPRVDHSSSAPAGQNGGAGCSDEQAAVVGLRVAPPAARLGSTARVATHGEGGGCPRQLTRRTLAAVGGKPPRYPGEPSYPAKPSAWLLPPLRSARKKHDGPGLLDR